MWEESLSGPPTFNFLRLREKPQYPVLLALEGKLMKLNFCTGFILAGLQLSLFKMPGCQALKEERFRYTVVVSVF